jgi:subtilisin family serine protease
MSMADRPNWTGARAALGVVVVAGLAMSAGAAGPLEPLGPIANVPRFVERPGIVEFSGKLIVRPFQVGDFESLGYAPEEAQQRYDSLVASIPNIVRSYPETGEFIVDARAAARAGASGLTIADDAAAGAAENALSAQLMATGLFHYADPDWICFPLKTPNDPQYGNQWHLPKINAPGAWDNATGAGITLGFVDTGVYLTHPDLASQRLPGYNSASHIAEANGGDVSDINGHGTLVAGTGAAKGNNAVGVAGVGWNLNYIMVRTSNDSSGNASQSDILEGARWAIDNGAKSASCSYSGVNSNSIETSGVYIKGKGGLLCYAAGNDAADLSTFDFANVIIVGASDGGDGRASFSAYGRAVDLFAPGVSIYATTNGGGYGSASGTSFSTPMVNGAIGVIWSVAPAMTNNTVENILLTTCKDLGSAGNDNTWGWGRVDLSAAVTAARALLSPLPPTAASDAATALWSTPLTIDVLANDADPNPGDTISITSFPATTSHGTAVTRSVGTGPGGRDQLIVTPNGSYTGIDSFTYTISDQTNRTANATVSFQIYDPASLRDPDPPLYSQPGVRVHYFYPITGMTQLPDFDSMSPNWRANLTQINITPTVGFVGNGGASDNVAAQFTGWVNVPIADYYTFFVESDEGAQLFVGDQLVVDNDGLHSAQERSGSIGLKPGRHKVVVRYFEATGSATCVVKFQTASGVESGGLLKQVIPTNRWTRMTCPADMNNDDMIDLSDLFTFLNAFDQSGASADLNNDDSTDLGDLFLFLNLFDSNCTNAG